MKHAFRNALIPLVTVVALDFGAIFAGAIVTETIFTLDGMGFYFINALQASDPYPVMAWLMVVAVDGYRVQPHRRHPVRRLRPEDSL